MPAERLSMRKIREVLRLRAQGRSDRQVARSANLPLVIAPYLSPESL